jgi:hypothetical protein
MTRRKLALFLVLGLVAAASALALPWTASPPKPGISAEDFQRLSLGMTLPEVKGILGEPGQLSPLTWTHWRENGGFIAISFDNPDGGLKYATANLRVPGVGRRYLSIGFEEPFLRRVRRWLGI